MRLLALALCGALLTAGLAHAAPADRAALLERLEKALPTINQIMPVAELLSSDLREDMNQQNPGKEALVRPIADAFGACMAKMFDSRDFSGEAVAAADKAGMTDAELLKVIAFYEDPEVKEMFSKLGAALASDTEPDFAPEKFERIEQAMKDPAVMRFSAIMQKSSESLTDEEAMMDLIIACTADLDEAVDDAGLTYVPSEDEGGQ